MSLTKRILIAMGLGIVAGIALNRLDIGVLHAYLSNGLFYVVGKIFISALKMLVVPLVLVSLTNGVTSLGDIKALGRIGLKAITLYLITTALAISIALTLTSLVAPGSSAQLSNETHQEFQQQTPPSLGETIIGMVPDNPVAALADGNMLQIIIFALIFGVAITLAGERGRHVLNFFADLNEVVMKMVLIVMKLAPYGVFCLVGQTFATQGWDIIKPLSGYFLTLVAALLIHALATYSLLLQLLGRLNPVLFFRKMRAALVFAFSTASSNATIPVTLSTVEKRLGVDNSIASFTIPLGATINMDGTAIMQGVATVFIANIYGLHLGINEFLMVIVTATLASVGTAGVPGVGLVMLAMVLKQVNLPVEGIALIIGVDRLLDMMRTAVNICGDAMATCLIAKSEKALNETLYADPLSGQSDSQNS